MTKLQSPALDPADIEIRTGSIYPAEFAAVVAGRAKRALTKALGLTQFGVNLTELAPGAVTALRHWHSHEDEFIYVLQGNVQLHTSAGVQDLGPGQCAGFPAGVADGHRLVNTGTVQATLLEVGSRDARDTAEYPDVDLRIAPDRYNNNPVFTRKDGTPLP